MLDLIPEIENTAKYDEWIGGFENEDGSIQAVHCYEELVVLKFHRVVYKMPIIINFEWSSWELGEKIENDYDFDFDTIDIPTICKYITRIVKSDRYCEVNLVFAFESGRILKILKSIKKRIDKMS